MKMLVTSLALFLAACGAAARAEAAKPADQISGCVERATIDKYISQHNFAELLRGQSADGKTSAIWTNGLQVLVVTMSAPPTARWTI